MPLTIALQPALQSHQHGRGPGGVARAPGPAGRSPQEPEQGRVDTRPPCPAIAAWSSPGPAVPHPGQCLSTSARLFPAP